MQRISEYISSLWADGWQSTSTWLEQSDRTDWTIIFAVALALGLVCMRGFKARL